MTRVGSSVAGWRLEQRDRLAWIVCDALTESPGVRHAFSTRVGPGGEEFDLGAHDASCAPFDDRRRLLCRAAGLDGQRPLALQQVHGKRIASGREAMEGGPLEADGILVLRGETPGHVAAVRTADCVPILLADLSGRAVAAIHAGWRGTARKIVESAVDRLDRTGIPAESLIAAVGPAIGACCYEVGQDVAARVADASGVAVGTLFRAIGGRRTLDLALANRLQLRRSGIREGAIHTAPWCTACRQDLFFSYRANRGPTGRLMACIGWSGDLAAP